MENLFKLLVSTSFLVCNLAIRSNEKLQDFTLAPPQNPETGGTLRVLDFRVDFFFLFFFFKAAESFSIEV